MNTNILEQRLLDKELARIQAEINRGMTIVNNVLMALPRSHTAKENEKEALWILLQLKVGNTYNTGTHKHAVKPLLATEFPESMRERILKNLVTQFLEELEQMQEITADLESRVDG